MLVPPTPSGAVPVCDRSGPADPTDARPEQRCCRHIGRPAGEQLEPLRYANTWIAALDPSGTVVYVDPDKVQLDQVDLAHFAERDPQQVGDFWAEWTLDDEDLTFRRRRSDQQPKVLCPSCGVRQKVTGKGRLEIHLGRDMPRDGPGDRRCVGSGLLARVDVPGVREAVPPPRAEPARARRPAARRQQGRRREAGRSHRIRCPDLSSQPT